MAVAPLNKFLTVAVPVAPGEQTIYTTPTGVSAIVLYAQCANVGIGTFPTITFTHRRKSTSARTVGNTRNIRVIKDIEIPPNDSLVIIDGRLVLERTAIITDSIVIEGFQEGYVDIDGCEYDENTGITTVSTLQAHNFSVGDEITMSNLRFTCTPGNYGLTTSIFPNPQKSFIVDEVPDANTFVTDSGISLGIPHTFVPAAHTFAGADTDAITVTAGSGGPFTPTTATYDGATGLMVVTVPNHGLTNGNTVRIADESIYFKCSTDNFVEKKGYPRATDPISGVDITVQNATVNTFTLDVGPSPTGGRAAPLQMEFICSILENSTT